METRTPQWRIVVALAAVYLVWSSTYLALRYVVEAVPPILAAGTRYVAAGSLLVLIARLSGSRMPTRREWLAALATGPLLCVVGNAFVAVAERRVSSGLAAVVCAAMPIFACFFDTLWGERTGRREWTGVAVGFCGVLSLGLGDLRATPGSAAMLCCAPIGWALGSCWSRRLPRPPGVMAGAIQLLCGGLVGCTLSFLVGEHVPSDLPVRAISAWIYLVVFGSLVAFSAYTYLLHHTRTAVATSYAYVNPLLALVLGASLGREHVGGSTLASTGLIAVGVVLVVTAKR